MTRPIAAAAALGLALLLTACSSGPTEIPVTLPPAGAGFDSQLGGESAPPEGVSLVIRDSTAPPAGAGYDVCFVDGFQTRAADSERWLDEDTYLVLHDAAGTPVADPGRPGEYLLDTSTAFRRSAILAAVSPAIAACAAAGYDAIVLGGIDSYTRSGDLLTIEGNIALAVAYAKAARLLGLAIAPANGAQDAGRLRDEVGFDFVVAEDCALLATCAAYTDAYGDQVFDIEYDAAAFATVCGTVGSAVLRDRGQVVAGDPAYVYQSC